MDKGFVTPQIQTANSKRLLPADTVGREKAHTHSHRPAFLLQGHTACNCCDFSTIRAVCWCRGESRGQILHAAVSGWPSRLSPRAHCDHSAQAAQTQRHFSHAGHGPRSPSQPHCLGRVENSQPCGAMPNQVWSPAHFPPRLSLQQGHPHCSLSPACSLCFGLQART